MTAMTVQASGAESAPEALRLASVTKVYGSAESDTRIVALDDVSLTFPRSGFVAVMGPSGSGKSTLLQCASGLDLPTSGSVYVGGRPMPTESEAAVTRFRRDRIGFVFQQYNLIPYLSVEQNIALPLRFARLRVDRARLGEVLASLDLTASAHRRPVELSGGQQLRLTFRRPNSSGSSATCTTVRRRGWCPWG